MRSNAEFTSATLATCTRRETASRHAHAQPGSCLAGTTTVSSPIDGADADMKEAGCAQLSNAVRVS